MNNELVCELKDYNIITADGNVNKQAQRMLNKYNNTKQNLFTQTSFLPIEATILERIYCIRNSITSLPVCKVCNSPVSFNRGKKTYNTYCPNTKTKSCASKDGTLQKQRTQTLIDRYGVDNPSKNAQVREKTKNTNIRRYGGETPISSDEVKDKMKKTNIERYGTPYACQDDNIKEKIRNTNMERFGTSSYALSQKDPKVINKIQKFSNDRDWMYKKHIEEKMSVSAIASYLGLSNKVTYDRMHSLDIPITTYKSQTSEKEEELRKYIKDWVDPSLEVVSNSKVIAPYELDIYIPSMKLAFEFDGIFWHSQLSGKDKFYHLNKTKLCQQHDIKLIHVWSYEWEYNNILTKSRIRNLLGRSETVYGRECEIVELTSNESSSFLQHNHIQGKCSDSIRLGLKHDEMLVAVMTFGKSRYNKQIEYELLRFCNVSGKRVIGGASKLFKHFKQHYRPKSVISYSDKRWNTGTLYTSLGFSFSHTASPNYWYFNRKGDTNKLYSRIHFQKHKLDGLLEKFDPELTEWQNMVDHGYDRIWDCGNDVYIWKD